MMYSIHHSSKFAVNRSASTIHTLEILRKLCSPDLPILHKQSTAHKLNQHLAMAKSQLSAQLLLPSSFSSSIKCISPKSPLLIHIHTPNKLNTNTTLCCYNSNITTATVSLKRRHVTLRGRFCVVSALEGAANPKRSEGFNQWDSLTAKFSGAANLPFLLLQLPQIVLNARNLLAGNNAALLAVPWLGMLTGLLGNLSLLSYFAKKKEKEAVVVQTLGVVSTYVVISQLAMGDAMPLPEFVAVSVVVATGLVLNFLNYFSLLNAGVWRFWEDFITVGGLAVLPQVMWSTFLPYVPDSILPGSIALVIALVAIVMARMGKLSEKAVKFIGRISGWTATLLFMWMPISQMWTNFLNPDNIKGLSPFSMLLAMLGNGLLIPRALFIRDFMWFLGSTWSTLFYGYGNLVCMYCFNSINKEFFFATTAGLILWIGTTLWRDAAVYGHNSPLRSLYEVVSGC